MIIGKIKKVLKNFPVVYFNLIQINNFISRIRNIRGKNNYVQKKGILQNVQLDVRGDCNTIIIEEDAKVLNFKIYIRGNNHILRIGKGCIIKGGSVWFEDNDCEISIGEFTTIEAAHLAITEPGSKILIGKDCMFSYGIYFRTGDSHSIIDIVTGNRINFAKDIIVKDHVWIGADVKILKGVTVHKQSVIGTGSIVVSDVPENSIVAGIPAKIVKTQINWLRERIYLGNS